MGSPLSPPFCGERPQRNAFVPLEVRGWGFSRTGAGTPPGPSPYLSA
jgi:hypothetical protein